LGAAAAASGWAPRAALAISYPRRRRSSAGKASLWSRSWMCSTSSAARLSRRLRSSCSSCSTPSRPWRRWDLSQLHSALAPYLHISACMLADTRTTKVTAAGRLILAPCTSCSVVPQERGPAQRAVDAMGELERSMRASAEESRRELVNEQVTRTHARMRGAPRPAPKCDAPSPVHSGHLTPARGCHAARPRRGDQQLDLDAGDHRDAR
jgi:hypothetical protein